MASHRRPKQPSRARVTVLTTAAAAAVALTSQAANAAPAEKPSKDEVKAKVHKLYEDAGRATDKLNGAEEKQEKLEKEISAIQDNVAKGQEDLNELREGIGLAASAQYRSGGIDSSIQLFLSADPDDYLDKAATLDQLTSQQVESLKKVQEKQRTLAQQRQEATEKLADLADTRETLAKKKKEVQSKLAAANKLLNTLTAEEKADLDEQETRASRDAGDRVELGNEAPASDRGAAALAAAGTQVGKPYVSGGSGPNSYDCSGLTQWAYAQAGVSITRTTYTQANDGTRIGRGELMPGDLVFFNDLGHVGLYAGNGTVIHAPYPGKVVRYESMSTIGSFQFGVRIG
ncbi:NlpC/P60 family protein [Streptomyces europaeiscabiei]|uniref:NlpC/P60 family protein n=1 Tax=Streptomyces europaeiscabiei TaxID=146819 RepID=A0ABU4NF57_9ACTN|nr:C40 family peptidase [Streptomyces europaeiscabiei]MDX2530033.1 NlpC/P60 family protein [Streptomyces europaeiscabiei]MDX2762107.1 NlpC/P60 family protein [Streptomyces europaeiscabiei]MDX2768836.1 NlpC/P60 family protein [Streptomyces europaeiscabiei]MDX3543476.1 NlpC/P60 family protein [Streptomyces europaeiscabiei]MDX3553687.1 NlpC/P60 family protein [Streptomyces europaeiscabiei]